MSPTPKTLRLATRGSRLALRQTELVAEALRAAAPGTEIIFEVVKTTGDRDLRPYAAIGSKGIFTAEIERAVVEGRADLAVHSAKDLTAELAEGCSILFVPPRADPRDVVVGGGQGTAEERLGSLAPDAKVGTSSMRRRALLAEARPDLDAVELRGNLDTRVRKVQDGEVQAAILAAAGLQRLPELEVDIAPLDPSWWIPAPGQGAIAVEGPTDSPWTRLLRDLSDPIAVAEISLERAFAARLEGGCSVPLGCLARSDGRSMDAVGFLGGHEGIGSMRDRISGPPSAAVAMGEELADAILAGGGKDILEDIRAEQAPAVEAP